MNNSVTSKCNLYVTEEYIFNLFIVFLFTHSSCWSLHVYVIEVKLTNLYQGSLTNISHWLKVHSRWFKNNISAKECILISFKIFQYCFYHSITFYYCAIFNSLNVGTFSNSIRVSNSLYPDQARHVLIALFG